MSLPTTSIVMPNYNHGPFLEGAIECALRQRRPPLEIIVIDDGSTDDSARLLSTIAERSPLIRAIYHRENFGVVASMNRGLAEASGQFVLFSAVDDRLDPEIVEKSMTAAAENPSIGIIFSDPAELAEDGPHVVNSLYLGDRTTVYSADDMVRMFRRIVLYLSGANVFFNRAHLCRIDGFDPELRWHADFFSAHALAFRHGACYVPRALAYRRVAEDSYSSGARDWKRQAAVVERWLVKLEEAEWEDIRGCFRKSTLLPEYSLRALGVCLRHEVLSGALLRRVLGQELWNRSRAWAPRWLRNRGRRARAAKVCGQVGTMQAGHGD